MGLRAPSGIGEGMREARERPGERVPASITRPAGCERPRARRTHACARRRARAAAAALLIALPVSGLHAQPRDIVLMLDNSGSMRANDPDFLTNLAVRTFLERLDGDNHVALVAFDQRVNVLMPLTPLNNDTRWQFLESLAAINYRGLLTNSPAAMERSLYELRESGRPGAEKSIVFMTDGIVDVAPEGPDAGDVEKARWMKSTLVQEAADQGVRIFGIAFTDNADFELIQTLAKRTGGEYFRAYSPGDIDTVFANVRDLLSTAGVPAQPPPAPPPIGETPRPLLPDREATVEKLAGARAAPALPEAGSPAASPELPDSGSPPPVPALPDAAGVELPQVSLPDVDLPTVTLPEVNVGGAAAGAEARPATVAQPDPPRGQPEEGTLSGAQTADAAQPAGGNEKPATPPVAPAPPAPPRDDTPLMLILGIGGAALLLALVALIVVLARRKGGATQGTDVLMPKAFLNDLGGVTEQKSYELDEMPTVVGRLRGPATDAAHYIVIDETTVGRRHALFEYKEHSFWVTDQNSLNGTFVNNRRIEAATRLKHGDRVRFHKHEFEFLVLDMFETDRTMISNTLFADLGEHSHVPADEEEEVDDATVVKEGECVAREPSPEDPTITRA